MTMRSKVLVRHTLAVTMPVTFTVCPSKGEIQAGPWMSVMLTEADDTGRKVEMRATNLNAEEMSMIAGILRTMDPFVRSSRCFYAYS